MELRLRNHLRQTNPELADSLERSWEIALNEWLPAIFPRGDSYNSYPHLRNLEMYLEKIVAEYERVHNKKVDSLFTPIEIYVLLISILVHDIGKIRSFGDHGILSGKIILENYSKLGIPTQEIATVVSKICKFHNYDPIKCDKALIDELSTVSIDPYGLIRERNIGAVLLLIDHLDATFNRIIPEFVVPSPEKHMLGEFRRLIQSVDIDLKSQMIKVQLSEDCMNKESLEDKMNMQEIFNYYSLKINNDRMIQFERDSQDPLFIFYKALFDKAIIDSEGKFENGYGFDVDKNEISNALLKDKPTLCVNNIVNKLPYSDEFDTSLFKKLDFDSISCFDKLICGGIVQIEKKEQKLNIVKIKNYHDEIKKEIDRQVPVSNPDSYLLEAGKNQDNSFEGIHLNLYYKNIGETNILPYVKQKPWHKRFVIETILANLGENISATVPIKHTLAAMGIPVQTWAMEFNEHLYNQFGNEMIEPIFHSDYLLEVLKGMWQLNSGGIASETKFKPLSDRLGKIDVENVKMAVKRIAKLAESVTKDAKSSKSNKMQPFTLFDDGWKWNVTKTGDTSGHMFWHFESVIKLLKINFSFFRENKK